MVTARATGRRTEDESRRDQFTRVFANPDGTWTSETASAPESVRDAEGAWHDVDTTVTSRGGRLVPMFAAADVSFSAGGNNLLATVTKDGSTASWRWPGMLPKPTVTDDTVTYAGAADGADLVLRATATGFEESVVLQQRPTHPVRIATPILIAGGRVEADTEGAVRILGKSGKTVVTAARPLMWDASKNEVGDPEHVAPVDTTVVQGGQGSSLVMSPDSTFLSDPATVYPVVVDPSFTTYPSSDSWLENPNYTTSQVASDELRVGTYDSGGHKARAFMHFENGDSTWKGKWISSANLVLRNWYSGSCTGAAIRAARITESWSTPDLTWANQPSATSTGSDTYSAAKGYTSSCAAGDATWVATPIVQTWADNTATNYGIRLKADDETSIYTWRKYRSANYGGSTQPHLNVTYDNYPGTASAPTVTPVTAYAPPTGASYNYTNSSRPTLTSRASDADGGTVKIAYEVRAAASGTATLLSSCTTGYVAQGSNAACALGTALADNQTVYIRAKAFDGQAWSGGSATNNTQAAATGWSAWSTLRVALAAPPQPSTSCPSPYADGSWADTPPAGPVTCTITATGSGTTSPGYIRWHINNGTETRTKIAQPTATAPQSITITVPNTAGGYKIYASTESPSGVLSTAKSYSLGFGRFSISAPTPDATGAASATTANIVPVAASGPPDAVTNPTATLKWRVAASGDDDTTGWTTAGSDAKLSVSSNGTDPATVTGTWDTTAAVNSLTNFDTRSSVLLEMQLCLDYGATTACTWSTSPVQVLHVPHAFGDGYPVADAGPGQVALWTGEFSDSATDVDVPASLGNLTLSRTANSYDGPATGASGVFGPGWTAQLSGTDAGEAGELAVDNTRLDGTIALVDADGTALVFAPTLPAVRRTTAANLTTGVYQPVDDQTTLSGVKAQVSGSGTSTQLILTDPDGTITTFTVTTAPTATTAAVFAPESVQQPGQNTTTSYGYDGSGRVTRILGPVPAGVTGCANAGTLAPGCRALDLTYGTTGNGTDRLVSINLNTGDGSPITLVSYGYDTSHRLTTVTDSRTGLVTGYGYDGTSSRLAAITPPGLATFHLNYAGTGNKLSTVTRDAVSGSGTTRLATMVYDVPTDGTGGTPSLTGSDVSAWGQDTAPTHGYAVFGQDQSSIATDPAQIAAADFKDGSFFYTDDHGYTVNTATFGNDRWLFTDAEYDTHGNVIRALGSGDIAGIQDGDIANPDDAGTKTSYDAVKNATGDTTVPAGTLVSDTYGPARWAVVADGTSQWVRPHTHTSYDQGAPHHDGVTDGVNPSTGTGYGLVTSTVTKVWSVGDAADSTASADVLSRTDTGYDPILAGDTSGWDLGAATSSTTVMASGQSDITARTRYDAAGRIIESRQPSSNGTDAGTRQTVYYTAGPNSDDAACGSPTAPAAWAGAVCETRFAGTADGGAALPVTRTTGYDAYLSPTEVKDLLGGVTKRTTTTTYDAGDRVAKTWTTSSVAGSAFAAGSHYTYDSSTGLITTQASVDTSGVDTGQQLLTAYDAWGRQTTYTPAPGETTQTSYNTSGAGAGQVDTVTDPKGTTSYGYDGTDADNKSEHRHLATSVTVSNTGGPAVRFTGAYDATGTLVTQTLPGSITQRLTTDTAAEPVGLTYSGQVTNPDDGTTNPDGEWIGWSQDNDTLGRVVHDWTPDGAAFDATLSSGAATGYSRSYAYDRAGRLTHVEDHTGTPGGGLPVENPDGTITMPAGSLCATRDYTFDANGNRTKLVTAAPTDGTCTDSTSTATTTKNWTYDNADRLTGGYGYDDLGRATTIPAADTPLGIGAGSLTLGYYDTDALHSITQNGQTTSYTLDVAGRRATSTAAPSGGQATTTVVRHYTDTSDSPGWVETTSGGATTTTRYAQSLGGDLAATIAADGTVNVPVVDLHGDAVTTIPVPASGPATGINGWADNDEYGNPEPGTSIGATPTDATGIGYGWLGGKQRATTDTGLTLMGARLYNPVTGQFTSVDPVVGGNTTAYAYPQDPINGYDLTGEWGIHVNWHSVFHATLVGASVAAMFTCQVCDAIAVGVAVYQTIHAGHALMHRQYADAAWDMADVASFGIGRRVRSSAEAADDAVSAMSRKASRLTRRGRSYSHSAELQEQSERSFSYHRRLHVISGYNAISVGHSMGQLFHD